MPRRRRKVVVDGDEYASFGAAPENEDEEPEKCGAFEGGEGDLPDHVDLRPYMTAVENQRRSNSCAANAVAGAYEYLAKRAAMESGDEVGDISRLFIYYVGRKHDMRGRGKKDIAPKDSGMSICGAINALQRKGACLESQWPFDLSQVNTQPAPECWDQAMNYKISESMKVPVDLQKMKECLASGYPFVFGAKLTKPFFAATRTKGVVKTPDPEDPKAAQHGAHAMLCVGYNDEKQYFIVRNSWGAGWGDKGYCYMPYDYLGSRKFAFQCFAIKGLSDLDLTPESAPPDELPDPGEADAVEDVEVEEQEEEEEEDQEDPIDDDVFDENAEAKRAFDKCDADGSGFLAKREVRRALRLNGIRLGRGAVRKALAEFDEDGDGQISFEEYLTLCSFKD